MENSRFASVDQYLAALIRAWPTLFASREDALLRVATQSWNDKTGCPYREDDDSEKDLSQTFEEILAEKRGKLGGRDRSTLMDSFDHRMALERMRENHDALFTRNNADLIATLEGEFTSPPNLSIYNVNRWPATMTPAWKAAMVELADRILEYRDVQVDKHTESPISRDQYRAGLKEAQAAAREILARFAPERFTQAQKQERDQEVQKLRYAAEALGYKLTPVQQ